MISATTPQKLAQTRNENLIGMANIILKILIVFLENINIGRLVKIRKFANFAKLKTHQQ